MGWPKRLGALVGAPVGAPVGAAVGAAVQGSRGRAAFVG